MTIGTCNISLCLSNQAPWAVVPLSLRLPLSMHTALHACTLSIQCVVHRISEPRVTVAVYTHVHTYKHIVPLTTPVAACSRSPNYKLVDKSEHALPAPNNLKAPALLYS